MTSSRFVARTPIEAPAEELYAWHLRPGAFERLTPPWDRVVAEERPGPLEEGARVVLRVRTGPIRQRWIAEHRHFVEGRSFEDVQVSGPFARWIHRHGMEPVGEDRSTLVDAIEYAAPLGPLGRLLAGRLIRSKLNRMFRYRHALTAADLARHRAAAGRARLRVAVSGAGGLVGSSLSGFLRTGGHRVLALVRRPAAAGPDRILWDPASGRVDTERLEGLDAVVHLAGENIAAGRWTRRQKDEIRNSRIGGTRLIAESLARSSRKPGVLVLASAIGYYGDRGEEPLDETSPAGSGFLSETCREWEAAAEPAERAGIRVVRLRIGVVLSAAGGALARMAIPFRLGLGGRLGSGRQFTSWIALEDLVGIIHHALFDEGLEGPVNAVAPQPVSNRELTRTLGRVLRRPTPFPVPGFVLSAALGEMGRELLLAGARVHPRRLERAGFPFLFPALEQALRFQLGCGDGGATRTRIET